MPLLRLPGDCAGTSVGFDFEIQFDLKLGLLGIVTNTNMQIIQEEGSVYEILLTLSSRSCY